MINALTLMYNEKAMSLILKKSKLSLPACRRLKSWIPTSMTGISVLPTTNVVVDLSSGSPDYNATSSINNTLSLPHKLIFFFNILLSLYLGGTPYPTISNHKLFGALKTGYRMEKPQMCSDEM